jgi:hypothetical protein
VSVSGSASMWCLVSLPPRRVAWVVDAVDANGLTGCPETVAAAAEAPRAEEGEAAVLGDETTAPPAMAALWTGVWRAATA